MNNEAKNNSKEAKFKKPEIQEKIRNNTKDAKKVLNLSKVDPKRLQGKKYK